MPGYVRTHRRFVNLRARPNAAFEPYFGAVSAPPAASWRRPPFRLVLRAAGLRVPPWRAGRLAPAGARLDRAAGFPRAGPCATGALRGAGAVRCRRDGGGDRVDRGHAVGRFQHALLAVMVRRAARSGRDRPRGVFSAIPDCRRRRTDSPRAFISATRFSIRLTRMPSSTTSSITASSLSFFFAPAAGPAPRPARPCAESRRG